MSDNYDPVMADIEEQMRQQMLDNAATVEKATVFSSSLRNIPVRYREQFRLLKKAHKVRGSFNDFVIHAIGEKLVRELRDGQKS